MGPNPGYLYGPHVGGSVDAASSGGGNDGRSPIYANQESVLSSMSGVGPNQGAASGLRELLRSFTEGGTSLDDQERLLSLSAPFLAGSMAGTQPYQDLQNYQQRARAPLAQYGAQAGAIGQGAQQGVAAASQNLARSGLGRSSAMAGVQAAAQQQAASQRANLYSQLFQQSISNRQLFAQQAMDANRMMTALALGHNPNPRAQDSNNYFRDTVQGVAAGAGQLAGAAS